jgi:hypothetical protein
LVSAGFLATWNKVTATPRSYWRGCVRQKSCGMANAQQQGPQGPFWRLVTPPTHNTAAHHRAVSLHQASGIATPQQRETGQVPPRLIGIGGYKARAWSAVASPAVFEVRTTADSRGGGGPGRALRAQAQETRALAHFDFATHPNERESPFKVD